MLWECDQIVDADETKVECEYKSQHQTFPHLSVRTVISKSIVTVKAFDMLS